MRERESWVFGQDLEREREGWVFYHKFREREGWVFDHGFRESVRCTNQGICKCLDPTRGLAMRKGRETLAEGEDLCLLPITWPPWGRVRFAPKMDTHDLHKWEIATPYSLML